MSIEVPPMKEVPEAVRNRQAHAAKDVFESGAGARQEAPPSARESWPGPLPVLESDVIDRELRGNVLSSGKWSYLEEIRGSADGDGIKW